MRDRDPLSRPEWTEAERLRHQVRRLRELISYLVRIFVVPRVGHIPRWVEDWLRNIERETP